MRVWIQIANAQPPRDESGLVGSVVQPGAAQEPRSLDHVELAELGRDHSDHVETRAANVGTRDVDRVCGHTTLREPISNGLDVLMHVRAV